MSATRVPWQVKLSTLALIWGSSFLLMKVGLDDLHPVQIVTLRIVLAAVTLVLLLRVSGGRLPRGRRVWGHLFVCSLFLTVLPFTGFVTGELYVSSALAGIGNATTPIATVLCALAILPSERLTSRKLLAVALGFVGVVVIAEPWNLTGRPDPLGFALVVLAATSYGLGWTYNRRTLADVDLGGLAQPTALLLCGTVAVVPLGLGWWLLGAGGRSAPWHLAGQDRATDAYPLWLSLGAVAVLGIVGTGLAYILQYDVVRAAGTVVGSTVTYLIPVVSVILGVLVLGERLGPAQLVGFAIVLGAAIAVNRVPRTQIAAAPGGAPKVPVVEPGDR
ncbi:DMT family transporter [Nostocoides sp. F2B08]|uniref:DMT family transporter n=1 Tax=Nostocoides sp. F2B08 TaxID=2653936 RepID=UPI001D0399C9|nr:DMT family transporter [Tetrasphaera sp. F2B08]